MLLPWKKTSFSFFIVDSLPFLEFASFCCFHQLQLPFLNVSGTVFRQSDRRQLVLKSNTITPAANNLFHHISTDIFLVSSFVYPPLLRISNCSGVGGKCNWIRYPASVGTLSPVGGPALRFAYQTGAASYLFGLPRKVCHRFWQTRSPWFSYFCISFVDWGSIEKNTNQHFSWPTIYANDWLWVAMLYSAK